MLRDPLTKRADGNPQCFGNYLQGHYVCDSKCYKGVSCMRETEEDDKRREGKQFKNQNGVPLCFGELYSPYSDECQLTCNDAHDCQTTASDNDTTRAFITASPNARRSEQLNVLNNTYRYQNTPAVNVQTPNFQHLQVDDRTHQYIKQKYGIGLKEHPTIPGQFETEEWYERFLKEVLKAAGIAALQLLAWIIQNAAWAPPPIKKPEAPIGSG